MSDVVAPPADGRDAHQRIQTLIDGLRFDPSPGAGATALYARAYRALREALLSGAVAPGDLLNIRPLAGALGTSPMPVREALARLVADGALESLANRAFRVPFISRDTYRELLLIRLRLETLAAEHAAIRAEAAQIDALRELHERIVAEGRSGIRIYLALNRQFHFGVYRAAGIQTLYDMIETVWLRIGPLLHACRSEADHANAVDSHGELLDALERGDAGAAGKALQHDLVRASRTVFAYLTNAGTLAESS